MYILITYDVDTISKSGQKRLRNVAKTCKNYGLRVQNSVFECELTEAQFISLKEQLNNIISKELDSIRIYHLNKNEKNRVLTIGKAIVCNFDDELII